MATPGTGHCQARRRRQGRGRGWVSATQSMWALDMSLCRRNGKEGLSGMAIADITLLSGFSALHADLEKVQSAAQAVGGEGGWEDGNPCAPGARVHP